MGMQLQNWIDLSGNKKIPISLLLWSRAFFVTENPELLNIEPSAKQSKQIAFTTMAENLPSLSADPIQRLHELEKLEQEMISEDHPPIEPSPASQSGNVSVSVS